MPELKKMETKIYRGETRLKLDTNGEGTFEAVFATMNVVDKDSDVTENGAFGNQKVVISQWNHGSWDSGSKGLPIGVGKIFERGDDAIVQGEFDLSDPDGKKTYEKLKYLHSKGRNVEWSYALPEIQYRMEDRNGTRVRILEKISVPEVSPVMLGAGENTRLLDIKSKDKADVQDAKATHTQPLPLAEHIETVQADVKNLVERIEALGELREAESRHPSKDTMKRITAMKDVLTELLGKLEDVRDKHDTENMVLKQYMRFQKTISERRTQCLLKN